MNSLTLAAPREHVHKRTITEYHDISAFERLAQEWDELTTLSATSSPFLTRQWQKNWWNCFHHHRALRILTIDDENGRPCGIAPLYTHEKEGAHTLMLLGSRDLCDYLDFIVAPSREAYFYHTLLSHLASSTPTPAALCLNSIPHSSPTLHYFKDFAHRRGYTLEIHVEDTSPSLPLPSTFESYLTSLSQKNRHEIRRKTRKVTRGKVLTFKKIDNPSQLVSTMPSFLRLFRASAGEKSTFLTSQRERFFLTIAEECSRLGWIELFALSLDAEEVAYLFCLHYQDTLYLYNSAYDPTYAFLSPGIVVLTYCLEDAINRGIKQFDFLRGSEPYKYHFGAHDHALYTLTLHLPGEKRYA